MRPSTYWEHLHQLTQWQQRYKAVSLSNTFCLFVRLNYRNKISYKDLTTFQETGICKRAQILKILIYAVQLITFEKSLKIKIPFRVYNFAVSVGIKPKKFPIYILDLHLLHIIQALILSRNNDIKFKFSYIPKSMHHQTARVFWKTKQDHPDTFVWIGCLQLGMKFLVVIGRFFDNLFPGLKIPVRSLQSVWKPKWHKYTLSFRKKIFLSFPKKPNAWGLIYRNLYYFLQNWLILFAYRRINDILCQFMKYCALFNTFKHMIFIWNIWRLVTLLLHCALCFYTVSLNTRRMIISYKLSSLKDNGKSLSAINIPTDFTKVAPESILAIGPAWP